MYKNNSDQSRLCPAPWQLQGEAYILNYWLSPQFLKQAQPFGLTPSFLGRLVQVMWVRYHASPIGAYDELLILDHPLFRQRRLSTIRKISFQPSLLCNRTTALGHLKKLVSFYGFYVPELELTFPEAKIVTLV